MPTRWCVLSRKRGNKKWQRHIPGECFEYMARDKAALWGARNPHKEYDVQPYDEGPALMHDNGQLIHPRRRRRR